MERLVGDTHAIQIKQCAPPNAVDELSSELESIKIRPTPIDFNGIGSAALPASLAQTWTWPAGCVYINLNTEFSKSD